MTDDACTIVFDDLPLTGPPDQPLIDFLLAHDIDLPHVCYLRALGPIQTCDTCWVEVDVELKRACANSEDRLTTPLIRENSRFREASWDEALDLVARRLLEIRDQHGPRSIGFIASSKASNEEAYLTQKIARLIIGTNSVDNSSRYCQSPATKGLQRTVGIGADSSTIRDIEKAEVVVLVGTNTAENHPVIASRTKRAHKLHGQKLIVADPRKHEMAERADIFLRTRPSTDLVWASTAKTRARPCRIWRCC